VKIDINQFWNLLTESKLVGVAEIQALFSDFSEISEEKTPESLAEFLVSNKAITPYQSKILLSGHNGPFQYGNYVVSEQIKSGFFRDHFMARHKKTGYSVLLQFIAGSETSDLETWEKTEYQATQLASIRHPNLAETFESVTISSHRFVATQVAKGVNLQEKLPRKSRLPWKKACAVMAQAVKGLEELHTHNIVHNAVSTRTIWIANNGSVQLRSNLIHDSDFDAPNKSEKGSESKFDYLAPEAWDNPTADWTVEQAIAQDLYSVGCALYRIISGRPPFSEADLKKKKNACLNESPATLEKYDLPDELASLMSQLLAKQATDRPKTAQQVSNMLALLSGKAKEIETLAAAPSKARQAYRQSITPNFPGNAPVSEKSIPEIETGGEEETPVDSSDRSIERSEKIQAAAEAAQRRKKNQWKVPAAIAATLLAISSLTAYLIYNASQTTLTDITKNDPVPTKNSPADPLPPALGSSPTNTVAVAPEMRPTVVQKLIEDDDRSLWETPTNGPPLSISYLPPAPRILFSFRLSELLSSPEGKLVLQSLGPSMGEVIKTFQNQSGAELQNIERLTVSFHNTGELKYAPFFVVKFRQPIDKSRLMQAWNRPSKRVLENQQEIYTSSDDKTAFYLIYDELANAAAPPTSEDNQPAADKDESATEQSPEEQVTRFAFSEKQLIEDVALSLGASMLSGSLGDLLEWTDRDRHVNLLFLRSSLFNDQGQNLMGPRAKRLNRELSIMMPDEVRGGLVSFHLDGECYCELILDKNVDLKALDLQTMMAAEFRKQRDQLMLFVAKIPSSQYWDVVRIRYGGMLADFYKNLRWNVEYGQVVANCWLPPMAAHNLIAATEHAISFSAGTGGTVAPVYTGPQTLEELLAMKRDLNIANPPDLNVLISDLQTEIKDGVGKLPFAFNIRLIGSDLEKDGITKNQRPSELVIEQKSVSEILTSIMIAANPSKDITGANDPMCKLIWVLGDDPENPGQTAVLITTRTAAAAKSYQLPPAFQVPELP
jgi:serine/threonine protein kinase